MNQYRCFLIESCGKCQFAAYRSPKEQFCNYKPPAWTVKLDQWADGISSCCPLPIYNSQPDRGQRCIHCEVSNDVQFCHYHDVPIYNPQAVREKVLGELGKVLNSRIAKMEILDSKNPSPFRKGIIEAYRDIEKWEMLQRQEGKQEQP